MEIQLSDEDTMRYAISLLEELDMDEMKEFIEEFSLFKVELLEDECEYIFSTEIPYSNDEDILELLKRLLGRYRFSIIGYPEEMLGFHKSLIVEDTEDRVYSMNNVEGGIPNVVEIKSEHGVCDGCSENAEVWALENEPAARCPNCLLKFKEYRIKPTVIGVY